MTLEIASVLSILVIAIFFFVTEKIRMDVVALAVLSTLALTRFVGIAFTDAHAEIFG